MISVPFPLDRFRIVEGWRVHGAKHFALWKVVHGRVGKGFPPDPLVYVGSQVEQALESHVCHWSHQSLERLCCINLDSGVNSTSPLELFSVLT